jgi:DNA primase
VINDQTIADIKNRIDIEEVVADFVSLKRKGQNLWACCPFHNEKTPSFTVSPSKGFYKCFGCGKGGDAIDFVMEVEKIDYPEALRYMAKKYGIEIQEEELTDEQQQAQSERESLMIALSFARDHFTHNLNETDEGQAIGQSYFEERQIDQAIVEKFEMGYAIDQWDDLLTNAQKKGYSADILESAGLLVKKGDRTYDRFRGRVIFPIHNITGRVIGFGARALKKDDKPKYINSPETQVYQKSAELYGMFQAKQAIRQLGNCYLVEGYTDVTALHQIGIENVVASSGTSLTEEQVRLISRFSKQVTILYDGDMAGIKASLRGLDIILAQGLSVKIVLLPEEHDPDSYAKYLGANEFKVFIEDKAQDFIHFKSDLVVEEAGNDPVKKADSIREIVASISFIPDPVNRAVYIKEAAAIVQLDEQVLISELNKILLKRRKKPNQEVYTPEVVQPHVQQEPAWSIDTLIAHQERESIRLLIRYGFNKLQEDYALYQYLFDELEEVEFVTPIYSEIFKSFKEALIEGTVVNADFFIKNGTPEVRKEVIDLVHEKYEPSSHWHEKYKIYVPVESEETKLQQVAYTNILRLKQRVIRKLVQENLLRLENAKTEHDQTEAQMVHQELKAAENEIAKELGNVILK